MTDTAFFNDLKDVATELIPDSGAVETVTFVVSTPANDPGLPDTQVPTNRTTWIAEDQLSGARQDLREQAVLNGNTLESASGLVYVLVAPHDGSQGIAGFELKPGTQFTLNGRTVVARDVQAAREPQQESFMYSVLYTGGAS